MRRTATETLTHVSKRYSELQAHWNSFCGFLVALKRDNIGHSAERKGPNLVEFEIGGARGYVRFRFDGQDGWFQYGVIETWNRESADYRDVGEGHRVDRLGNVDASRSVNTQAEMENLHLEAIAAMLQDLISAAYGFSDGEPLFTTRQ